ncbi:MAG: hypothetical protein HYU77_06865 [Betaproteobacteria bacterium]|nr:hypothetical protein [Betaproteobacteria bacterium]
MNHAELKSTFDGVDREIAALEGAIRFGRTLPLGETVEQAIAVIKRLIVAYLEDEERKQVPMKSADILEVLKALVKGEPSWNAIRDNCRELVYYRNCLAMDRKDALPAAPEKMAVRTARHVYLYIKTRCLREGRLED